MQNNNNFWLKTLFTFIAATAMFFVFKSVLPAKLFPESSLTDKIVVDSLMLEALKDKNNEYGTEKDTSVIAYEPFEGIVFPSEKFENYTGSQYLIPFFEKLYQLETTKEGSVRIAYFGDSMTDGDMIVKDLRIFLQEKFGGKGVGFVSITSESAASRSSITHDYSQNWQSYSYLKTKRPNNPFGVNGGVFYANDTFPSWVRYKASATKFSSELIKPTLFYGYSKNNKGKVYSIVNGDTISAVLQPNKRLNRFTLTENNVSSFKLHFKNADSIPFYGFNFDSGKGVQVDNFSSRGNSGLPLSMLNKNTMRAFQEVFDYDLIILHYGTNVLGYGSLNFSWYEKRMKQVVSHLRDCFPNAEIMVISAADKATKYDLEIKTDSAVAPLVRSQKNYAVAMHAGYMDLYKAMGGEGSMKKWAEQMPAKANKDYTHFNFRGAKEIAQLLHNQMDRGYKLYKRLRVNRKPLSQEELDSIARIHEMILATANNVNPKVLEMIKKDTNANKVNNPPPIISKTQISPISIKKTAIQPAANINAKKQKENSIQPKEQKQEQKVQLKDVEKLIFNDSTKAH